MCVELSCVLYLSLSIANNCTFENGGLCAWRNSVQPGDDDFDWTIGSGSTSSSGTGPSTDHYGSRTGGFNALSLLLLDLFVALLSMIAAICFHISIYIYYIYIYIYIYIYRTGWLAPEGKHSTEV